MKYYIIAITFFLILFHLPRRAYSNDIFEKNTTIAHPETGLFFDYVGLYTPSETIIHNSAIFPMTTDTCHFLPLSAAENIPSCNITRKRNKRFVDVISLGIGTASLALSAANSMQIASLKEQMALVDESLSKFSQSIQLHQAQLVKITSKQIEIIEELQFTQEAINAIVPVLESHSIAINDIKTNIEQLHVNQQRSFLYLAITQILRNDLNLNFLSSDDLQSVIYDVIEQGKLIFNSYYESLPIVHIITNLLVRQQIDFVPRSQYRATDSKEIGRLVITSYFAVPKQNRMPFYTYKLVTIPFFYENKTMQLAHVPRYWAINPVDNTTMEWHEADQSGCNLQLMTTCRDTPPIRTFSKDSCLDQIMEGLPISKCGTTLIPTSPYFIRSLRDNLWITSSPRPMHCLKTPQVKYFNTKQYTEGMNEEIILPHVALVNVTPGYTVSCPGFTLVGRSIPSYVPSLIILYNSSASTKNISVMDVYKYITENITWFKDKNMVDRERDALKDFIYQTDAVSHVHTPVSSYLWPFGLSISSWVFIGLGVGLVCYVFRRKS